MKILRFFLLFLVFVGGLNAQSIQKAHCVAATSCTLPNPVVAGDTLVAVGRTALGNPKLSDAGNTWTGLYASGWNGENGTLSYATNAAAGTETLQFSLAETDIILLEYPPAKFDSRAAVVHNCCAASVAVGPITTTAPQELLITWVVANAPSSYAISGFTAEDTGTTLTEADQIVPPGTYIANVLQGQGASWGASLVAFILTASPPPPNLVNLTVNTKLFWCTVCDGKDDIPMTGSLRISQQQTSASFGLGTDGSVRIDLAINVGVDPVDFTFDLIDGSGAVVPGSGFEWKVPQSAVQSNSGFILGILGLQPLRFAHGPTMPIFKGFVTP